MSVESKLITPRATICIEKPFHERQTEQKPLSPLLATDRESFRVLEKSTVGCVWTRGAPQTSNKSQEQQQTGVSRQR